MCSCSWKLLRRYSRKSLLLSIDLFRNCGLLNWFSDKTGIFHHVKHAKSDAQFKFVPRKSLRSVVAIKVQESSLATSEKDFSFLNNIKILMAIKRVAVNDNLWQISAVRFP